MAPQNQEGEAPAEPRSAGELRLALLATARDAFLAVAPAWAGEKWVAEANLHVTLRFIGMLPDTQVDAAAAALAGAAALHEPFALRLAAFRARPTSRRAHMVWATLDDTEGACASLAADVAAALVPFGKLQRTLSARGSELPILFLTGRGDIPRSVAAMTRNSLAISRSNCCMVNK
jgi:hypothetical protein